MYHALKFDASLWADLERSPKQPLERVELRRGSRRRAQLRPYVVETPQGPVEVADLFFEDGSTVRAVPFAAFAFDEEPPDGAGG
jgi:hypothetical protein